MPPKFTYPGKTSDPNRTSQERRDALHKNAPVPLTEEEAATAVDQGDIPAGTVILPDKTPVVGPTDYIMVDAQATGVFERMNAPLGWFRDRRLLYPITVNTPEGISKTVNVNLEHVSEDENGAWCYRRM